MNINSLLEQYITIPLVTFQKHFISWHALDWLQHVIEQWQAATCSFLLTKRNKTIGMHLTRDEDSYV